MTHITLRAAVLLLIAAWLLRAQARPNDRPTALTAVQATADFDEFWRDISRHYAYMSQWQVQFEMAKACLGKNDFSAAIRHANTAAELAPHQYSGIHLLKGYAFLALADHAQAITELQQYLSEQPESLDALAARRALDQAKTFFSNPE